MIPTPLNHPIIDHDGPAIENGGEEEEDIEEQEAEAITQEMDMTAVATAVGMAVLEGDIDELATAPGGIDQQLDLCLVATREDGEVEGAVDGIEPIAALRIGQPLPGLQGEEGALDA